MEGIDQLKNYFYHEKLNPLFRWELCALHDQLTNSFHHQNLNLLFWWGSGGLLDWCSWSVDKFFLSSKAKSPLLIRIRWSVWSVQLISWQILYIFKSLIISFNLNLLVCWNSAVDQLYNPFYHQKLNLLFCSALADLLVWYSWSVDKFCWSWKVKSPFFDQN